MPPDVERRLERLLSSPPDPSDVTERRARTAAQAAAPAAAREPRWRRWPRLAAVPAAVAAAMGIVGVGLAATGGVGGGSGDAAGMSTATGGGEAAQLDSAGGATGAAPLESLAGEAASLPARSVAFGLLDRRGRLWLQSIRGRDITGRLADGAAVSPGALYLVSGDDGELTARALADGDVAWRLPQTGRALDAVWSPYPIRVAYLVAATGAVELHTVWGNGRGQSMRVRGVAPVAPSWRSDSLAIAYVARDGRVRVHEVLTRHDSAAAYGPANAMGDASAQKGSAACAGRARQVAFAPKGDALASVTDGGVTVASGGRAGCLPLSGKLAWRTPSELLLITDPGSAQAELARVSVQGARLTVTATRPAPGALALAVSPDRRTVAVASGSTIDIVPARFSSGAVALAPVRTYDVPAAARSIRQLIWL